MNKLRTCPQLVMIGAIVTLIGFTMPAASLASDYEPGFRWDRSDDWVPGIVPGSMAGNPAADKNGNPVWFYGYTSGGELGSSNPWYAQQLLPMVWDDEWWSGSGQGVWARGYNGPGATNVGTNPPIGKWLMAHDMSASTESFEYMPVVEWRNPIGGGAIVDVGGSFKIIWEGAYTDNAPDGLVDIAVARMDSSTGSADLLYSATLTNPRAGDALWPGDGNASFSTVTEPWGVSGLRLDEGDALRFTLRVRGDETEPNFWVLLNDQSTDIRLVSTVPEPEQFVLLALGLGVLAVRLWQRNLTNRARRQHC